MSLPTGICANDELVHYIAACKNGKDRAIKISIRNEQLYLDEHLLAEHSTWEADYQKMWPKLIKDDQPCYILIRMDERDSSHNYDWIFITYTPDSATVRQKMLYAGTRAALKKEFGASSIREEYHAASRDDATFDGLQRQRRLKAAPAPMTEVEQELQSVRLAENVAYNHVNTPARQALKGVAFPIDQEALEKLEQFRDGLINYVQLSVDILNEAIKLERFDTVSVNQLRHCMPKKSARYHFYMFKHQYEGEYYQSCVFMYSMPSSGCSIKERMLYSSCKAPFLDALEHMLVLKPDRKIEIDSNDEVNEQFLLEELHPRINLHQPLFAKPKGPANQRGLRRINQPRAEI